MTASRDPQLQEALDALAIPGVLIGHRIISPDDALTLLPGEIEAFASSVLKVRAASGAARIVARDLIGRIGVSPSAISKSKSGMPVWPNGVVGSLAHDPQVAVAAVAARHDYRSLGVDVEPPQLLEPDLLDMVATPNERKSIEVDPYRGRLLFAVKEAVYKSVFPLDQTFLDYHHVEVDFAARTATTCAGRVIPFRYCLSPRIAVLAYISERTTV